MIGQKTAGLLVMLAICACDTSSVNDDFRDLNKNGRLDAYEDSTQPVENRIDDLLLQMAVAEKAGLMFINRAIVNDDTSLAYIAGSGPERHSAIGAIDQRNMNHFNIWDIPDDAAMFAQWQNNLQEYVADNTRLGIPVTIATDPRHHFSTNIFAFDARGFSQFPETLGLAAIGDMQLVEQFAGIVREEYTAVGFRLALHPQVDLATEPRWPRINGGFGEDAELSADIARAYIRGLQGEELSATSVATMTKHFPGGGPQKEGLDPHFEFQQGQIYPGGNFNYHLVPFEAAIDAGTAAIMPYYGIARDQTDENVAMAFNKQIITGLLRDKYNYDGVICTDWGVLTDITVGDGVTWPARAWGVEHLSRAQRVRKALDAGVDQFGGETATNLVVELVESGQVSEQRIDVSARRILRQKFTLGLFDNPFVDVSQVAQKIGTKKARRLGRDSQMRAMTLLKNAQFNSTPALPLSKDGLTIYLDGLDAATVSGFAAVANTPEDADVAIIRINTPWYPVETDNPFARGFHHGDLDFKGSRKKEILDLLQAIPTVVVIYLDRPAVIPEITFGAIAVIADFGASDSAVADVLFGVAMPEGTLPFELPSSMNAVRDQLTDMQADSQAPLFELGYGLRYE